MTVECGTLCIDSNTSQRLSKMTVECGTLCIDSNTPQRLSKMTVECGTLCIDSNTSQRLYVHCSSLDVAWTSLQTTPSTTSHLRDLRRPCARPPALRHAVFHGADVGSEDATDAVSESRTR